MGSLVGFPSGRRPKPRGPHPPGVEPLDRETYWAWTDATQGVDMDPEQEQAAGTLLVVWDLDLEAVVAAERVVPLRPEADPPDLQETIERATEAAHALRRALLASPSHSEAPGVSEAPDGPEGPGEGHGGPRRATG